MKITEYIPTPEYLYYDHMKRRKDALSLAVAYTRDYDRKMIAATRSKTLSAKQKKRAWWDAQASRELAIKAIQLGGQHERAAARILAENPHILEKDTE